MAKPAYWRIRRGSGSRPSAGWRMTRACGDRWAPPAAGWRGRVRELWRPIKARREYEQALALQARGVPTPAPLAWGVDGIGVGPAASWLVTETVEAAEPLLSFLEQTLLTLPPNRRVRIR